MLLSSESLSPSVKTTSANLLRSIFPVESKICCPKEATIFSLMVFSLSSLCAILSASMSAQPSLANSAAAALLPEPTPPKIPMIGFSLGLSTAGGVYSLLGSPSSGVILRGVTLRHSKFLVQYSTFIMFSRRRLF